MQQDHFTTLAHVIQSVQLEHTHSVIINIQLQMGQLHHKIVVYNVQVDVVHVLLHFVQLAMLEDIIMLEHVLQHVQLGHMFKLVRLDVCHVQVDVRPALNFDVLFVHLLLGLLLQLSMEFVCLIVLILPWLVLMNRMFVV